MPKMPVFFPLTALLLLGACTTIPSGPSAMVLPGTGKSFEQFRADDGMCRQYALEQIGGVTPNQAASESGVTSAAVGTALGAAVGAAISGSSEGAWVGAGTGLLVGGLAGTEAAGYSSYALQNRYDIGYIQCMYAKGHRVPVSGRIMREQKEVSLPRPPPSSPPPPHSNTPPPPPPGIPPPPPPGAPLP
jgi:hypothetical protein